MTAPVIFLAFFVIVGLIAVYGVIAKRKREKAMAEFAASQGWTPINDPAVLHQCLPQYLAGLGRSGYGFNSNFNRFSEVYDMAYQVNNGGNPIVFFQYQYTEYYVYYDPQTNSPQERSNTYYFVIVNARLAATVPTVVLLHHSFLNKLTTAGAHLGMQPLSLEGDFNRHLDVYITPNSQVEALSLLTPDTMELVLSAVDGASAEFSGQSLALSFVNEMLTPAVIQPVLANVAKLVNNIGSKAEAVLQAEVPPPNPTSPAAPSVT